MIAIAISILALAVSAYALWRTLKKPPVAERRTVDIAALLAERDKYPEGSPRHTAFTNRLKRAGYGV